MSVVVNLYNSECCWNTPGLKSPALSPNFPSITASQQQGKHTSNLYNTECCWSESSGPQQSCFWTKIFTDQGEPAARKPHTSAISPCLNSAAFFQLSLIRASQEQYSHWVVPEHCSHWGDQEHCCHWQGGWHCCLSASAASCHPMTWRPLVSASWWHQRSWPRSAAPPAAPCTGTQGPLSPAAPLLAPCKEKNSNPILDFHSISKIYGAGIWADARDWWSGSQGRLDFLTSCMISIHIFLERRATTANLMCPVI